MSPVNLDDERLGVLQPERPTEAAPVIAYLVVGLNDHKNVRRKRAEGASDCTAATICRFIEHSYHQHGWPQPPRDRAAVRMQSLGRIEYWLKALAQQGYPMITPRLSRGIPLTEAGFARQRSDKQQRAPVSAV